MKRSLIALALSVSACSGGVESVDCPVSPEVPTLVRAAPAAFVSKTSVALPLRPLRVCIEVPAASLAAVRAAVDGWREATRTWRDWRFVDHDDEWNNCDLSIVQTGRYSTLCDGDAYGCSSNIGGLADESEPYSVVFLPEQRYEDFATAVVLHEIGHAIGLSHKDGGLMQGDWPPAFRSAAWKCPDAETLDRLQEQLGAKGFVGCELPKGVR